MNNTKMKIVNKSELDKMLQKAIKQVTDLGIELSKPINPKVRNYKATSYFGQCRYRSREYRFEITISDYHLTDGYENVMDTLVHEVLHACKNARGHGEVWKRYANMVNKAYKYDIQRCGTYSMKIPTEKRPKANYIIECKECKHQYKRTRMSKIIKFYKDYVCGECNGKLERIM